MGTDGKDEEWDWKSKGEEVKKKIMKNGTWEGLRPIEGSNCTISINNVKGNWNSDLKIGEKVSCVVGDGDSKVNRLIERCLLTMDEGEEAFVSMDDMSCLLKLHCYDIPDTPIYEYGVEETLKKATEDKDKGNEYFREGRYEEAYSRFKHAVRLLIFAGKSDEKILPVYITTCNNIALCHIKLKKPELAIEVCDKVLQYDDKNVKALLRRSFGYNEVRDFEKAYEDLVKVLEIEPNNPKAKELLPSVKADITDMNKRYKSMVKKMFKYP